MREKLTQHHLVPQSWGGTYNPDNIVRIKERKHQAFHMVFDNCTPVQQIGRLSRFNQSALSPVFVKELQEILTKYCGENELYAYKNGVLIPRKFTDNI